jgi:hypothetical protein
MPCLGQLRSSIYLDCRIRGTFQISPQLCFAVIIHRHSLGSLLDAINLFASHHNVHYCNVPGQGRLGVLAGPEQRNKMRPYFQE